MPALQMEPKDSPSAPITGRNGPRPGY
jgi:hypothetical protein